MEPRLHRGAVNSDDVPVIVLCKEATGLATVRALADAGMEVHAFLLDRGDPLAWSRHGRKIEAFGLDRDEPALLSRLIDCAIALGRRPVVLPTSDATALMLALHGASLGSVCRVSSTSHDQLQSIVRKERLYETARTAGLPVLPFLFSPDHAALAEWTVTRPGPYLLKPSYVGAASAAMGARNQVVADRQSLVGQAQRHGLRGVLVQPLQRGGDGEIFDTYGCSDHRGCITALASHRRWRQYRVDLGSTCFGEIPAQLPARQESTLRTLTERLLRCMPYHGIFGIEWLRDASSGDFYLLDFNARPFLCIGHLCDCGLNLPWLACRDLIGAVPATPPHGFTLQHRFWLDLRRDLYARQSTPRAQRGSCWTWLASQMRASSYAYWRWTDPGPWMRATMQLVSR
ncbi:hypothetical protein [Ideonella sp. A 288]|uniref:hypothetical protein n=1 Tax=Ideonella sp. A 288 TaxID=1962181 RepID=UPI000B4B231B|nr:hypothetical protein [Ideonella sp. A 288]